MCLCYVGGFAKVKAGVHRATGEKVRNICTYVYEKCLFLSMTCVQTYVCTCACIMYVHTCMHTGA